MDKEFIQSLGKGLAVLSAFSRSTPSFTLAEVAKETGLSRAAARRVVLTLQNLGYLSTDGRQFFLRPRVLELGYAYLSSSGLSKVAQPFLETLNESLGEACSIGVLSESEVVYVARAQSHRLMTASMNVGTRLECTCTAIGRTLLAALPESALEAHLAQAPLVAHTPYTETDPDRLRSLIGQVREQGWAVVDQESEIGFRTAAAPVRNAEGEVIAAVNVGVHAARVTADEVVNEVLPQLLQTAAAIGQAYADRHAPENTGLRRNVVAAT